MSSTKRAPKKAEADRLRAQKSFSTDPERLERMARQIESQQEPATAVGQESARGEDQSSADDGNGRRPGQLATENGRSRGRSGP